MTGSKLTYWYGKQEVSWKDQWAIAATAALAVALLVAAIITVWYHARKNHIAILRLHQLYVSYAGGATVQDESVRKTKEDVVVSVENERQAGWLGDFLLSDDNKDGSKPPRRLRRASVSYEVLLNVACALFLAVVVAERFTLKLWLLEVDVALDASTVEKDPAAVTAFKATSIASGRVVIACTVILFGTGCYALTNVFVDTVVPRFFPWLFIEDVFVTHLRLHKRYGYLLGVAILLHVWSIFWPTWFHGTELRVLDEAREGLSGTDQQVPFWDAEKQLISLAPDDVWRFIEMNILWLVVIPYSVLGRNTRFSLATSLHHLAVLLFAVDSIRKPSHPHVHIFNTPVVVLWILDRAARFSLYRSHVVHLQQRYVTADNRYMICYFKLNEGAKLPEGEVMLLNYLHDYFELSHPYTIWTNRSRAFPAMPPNHKDSKVHYNMVESQRKLKLLWERMVTPDATPTNSYLQPPPLLENTKAETKGDESDSDSDGSQKDPPTEKSTKAPGAAQETATKPLPSTEIRSQPPSRNSSGPPLPLSRLALDSMANQLHPSPGLARLCSNINELTKEDPENAEWDFAAIIEVHRAERASQCIFGPRASWSRRLADQSEGSLLGAHGPYHAAFKNLKVPTDLLPPLVFVATGGGAAPMIDFVEFLVQQKAVLKNNVFLYYSSNSPDLFAYVTSILFKYSIKNLVVKGWITDSQGIVIGDNSPIGEDADVGGWMPTQSVYKKLTSKLNRVKSRDISGVGERLKVRRSGTCGT